MSKFVQSHKLPIGETVSGAFSGLFTQFFTLLWAVWLPLLLLVVFSVGVPLFFATVELEAVGLDGVVLATAFQNGGAAIQLFLFSVIGVAWYRKLILEEPGKGGFQFAIGKRELRYFGYQILLIIGGAVIILCLVGVGWLIMQASGGASVFRAYIIVSVLGLLYLFVRFALVFAAVSLSQPAPLRLAWKISEGNVWRLFFASLIMSLIFALIMVVVLGALYVGLGGAAGFVEIYSGLLAGEVALGTVLLVQGSSVFLTVLSAMSGVIFLSLAYRHLSIEGAVNVEAVFGDDEVTTEQSADTADVSSGSSGDGGGGDGGGGD